MKETKMFRLFLIFTYLDHQATVNGKGMVPWDWS